MSNRIYPYIFQAQLGTSVPLLAIQFLATLLGQFLQCSAKKILINSQFAEISKSL